MNPDIEKLNIIARKPERLIIGTMSGTSLDGLDVALCRFFGNGDSVEVKTEHFETVKYTPEQKEKIKSICSRENILLKDLCILNEWLALLHAEIIIELLKKWRIDSAKIDLLASHGQTIYHAPGSFEIHGEKRSATLQIGDGDHLAVATGIITVSDFRQKHVAAGGDGAPLAKYADHLLFRKKGEDRILLNIGGIANVTYLPVRGIVEEIICTDTGPGNILSDAYYHFLCPDKFYDEHGAFSATGQINDAFLQALMKEDFVHNSIPKTTGAELFNLDFVQKKLENIGEVSPQDIMRTLCEFTVRNIGACIQKINPNPCYVYVSGGGIHNLFLMELLKEILPSYHWQSTATVGVDPDAKEAVLFALLANEMITGNTVFKEVSLGKISLPH